MAALRSCTLLATLCNIAALQVKLLADVAPSPLVKSTEALLAKDLGEAAPAALADAFEYRDGETAGTGAVIILLRGAAVSCRPVSL